MAKKQDNKWIWIVILAIALFYIKTLQAKDMVFADEEIIEQLEIVETETQCTLELDKITIKKGQEVSGTINAYPNSSCEVYTNYIGHWIKLLDGKTDNNGVLVGSGRVDMAGEFVLTALCGEGIKSCKTNQAYLNVIE